jgi:TatD DNase family protein
MIPYKAAVELFDSHCHLDAEAFDQDREAVIERARAAGVTRIVTIGASNGIDSAARAIQLAEQHPNIWATVGVHPHDADLAGGKELLETMARHPKVVAIGETGLDFHYTYASSDNQKRWFREQIALARLVRKPLVIHCRNAAAECLEILQTESAGEVGGVFHCYSETAEYYQEISRLNFMVSFPGIITFKKAQNIRDAAKEIPLESILLETDAPYLAPEPYRGRRCESSQMVETAKALAEVHNIPVEKVANQTTLNALRFFSIQNPLQGKI